MNMEFRQVRVTREDVKLLRQTPPSERHPKNEDFVKDAYLNDFIPKPWGHEYRVYIDNLYDIWKLTIKPGHMTSTHCHPRKETVLICLAGHGRLRSSAGEQTVKSGDYVHIKKGAFHSTENIGNNDLDLVEVEMPRNKFDLVRVGDHYGRATKKYESEALDTQGLAPMMSVDMDKPALVRDSDLQGKYKFELGRFPDVVTTASVICHINVDVEPFLQDRICVYRETGQIHQTDKEHGLFLTIFHTNLTNEVHYI